MHWTCGTYRKGDNTQNFPVRKSGGKGQIGRSGCKWETVFKRIFYTCYGGGGGCTGFNWLRVENEVGLLCTQHCNCGCYKLRSGS